MIFCSVFLISGKSVPWINSLNGERPLHSFPSEKAFQVVPVHL